MKVLLTILFTGIVAYALAQDSEIIQEPTKGNYLGMTPCKTPKLLAPQILASSLDEYNGTFNHDGTAFFFTTNTPKQGIICFTTMNKDGSWNEVKVAPFSGEFSEYDPIFAPDGKTLYFSSERPIETKDSNQTTRIWKVKFDNNKCSEPELIKLTNDGDYYSSITSSGTIYYNVWDNGDLFSASLTDTGYVSVRLPDNVNSTNGEGDPFISPNEDYLIYRGYNESLGRGDFYITFRNGEKWSDPQNLGEPYNSSVHEMCPYITADGEYFVFASTRMSSDYQSQPMESIEIVRNQHRSPNNGQLNIYYVSADFIEKFRP